jgi:hypothetical protein
LAFRLKAAFRTARIEAVFTQGRLGAGRKNLRSELI